MKLKLLTILFLITCSHMWAQGSHEIISVGTPYLHKKKIYQELFAKGRKLRPDSLSITCLDVTKDDTVEVYSFMAKGKKSRRKDVYYSIVHINSDEDGADFRELYEDVLLKNRCLPAGSYLTHLTMHFKDSIVSKVFVHQVDSVLKANSAANRQFNSIYANQSRKSILGLSSVKVKRSGGSRNAASVLKKQSRKVGKTFQAQGFTVTYRKDTAKTFADVHYQDRYVGYYEVDMGQPIEDKIEKQKARLSGNLSSGVSTNLESNKPVFSQMKELHGEGKKNEVVGNLSLTGNMSSAQEEGSQNENNFFDVATQVEAPIMNLPFVVEAYYTSQDQARIAKASFFRLHYDAGKARSELTKLISDYKNKYHEASARGSGMQGVYGTYISKLASEKDNLWSLAMSEAGITNKDKYKLDTTGLFKEISAAGKRKAKEAAEKQKAGSDKLETVDQARETQRDAEQRYQKAVERYKKIKELEGKIDHYRTLLNQYQSNNYFDSVMAYDKLKDIDGQSADDMTLKQLSKSANSLLPEGESKKFTAGLTGCDIGIFSKEVSAYTLNGQTIKGADVGYDVGVCETSLTYGLVEYVSRDGQLDKYNGYSARTSFRPAKKQKTALIYYGYTPSSSMLKETFFNEVGTYMPAFRNPVHIASLVHSGPVTKHVDMEAEAASSFRTISEFREGNVDVAEKMAYRINLEGTIPKTLIDLRGGYEHIGKQFENNTLPMNLSGTEKYTAGANGQFYRGFLLLGVEYNYLIQQNFASRSVNSKWGFEIKTVSKRYPSATLSYKPFTTFRSFSDTLNVAQRPIFGAVWLGKLSYQIKKSGYSLRLTAIHNRNVALADTTESRSNITQLNAIYIQNKVRFLCNIGQTHVQAGGDISKHVKTGFLTLGAGYSFDSQWDINGGQDVGVSRGKVCKYAINMGCGYRFKNAPLALRTSFRYNTYQPNKEQGWKNIYSGMLDITWQFRFKIKEEV